MTYKDDLHKFNGEFTKLGASCIGLCSEYMQKRIYLNAIRPHHFQQQLRAVSIQMTLHELMATAVELEPGYKRHFTNFERNGGNSGIKPMIGKHGGKKIECSKCHRTHWNDERCPMPYRTERRPHFDKKRTRMNDGA